MLADILIHAHYFQESCVNEAETDSTWGQGFLQERQTNLGFTLTIGTAVSPVQTMAKNLINLIQLYSLKHHA